MQALFDHGRKLGFTAFRSGDFTPLQKVTEDANSESDAKRAAGETALLGALYLFTQILAGAKGAGVRFAVEPVDSSRLAYAAMSDLAEYAVLSGKIVNDILALRRDAPNLSIDWPDQAPELPPHQTIHVDVKMPDTMKAEITAMPMRETETAIERDKDGNITASRQVERDADAMA